MYAQQFRKFGNGSKNRGQSQIAQSAFKGMGCGKRGILIPRFHGIIKLLKIGISGHLLYHAEIKILIVQTPFQPFLRFGSEFNQIADCHVLAFSFHCFGGRRIRNIHLYSCY